MRQEKEQNLLFEKYKIAIQARNFHYDQFTKWATYFYLAIGVLFVAYYTIPSDKNIIISNSIPLLGYICSIIWYLSSKGYYFWSLNFIKIINHYEENLLNWDKRERVYTMLANKDKTDQESIDSLLLPHSPANFSTSKLSLLFSYVIAFVWGMIF